MNLGHLPGGDLDSFAVDVADGATAVVGYSVSAAGTEAFYWSPGGGLRTLKSVLLDAGLTQAVDWEIAIAVGISADGRTIAGFGQNPDGLEEGFIAVIPEPAGGALALLVLIGQARRLRHH